MPGNRALRGNSHVRLVRRLPKADPWDVYDALPAAIRAVLQEGPVELCPLAARTSLRRFHRFNRFCANDADAATDAYTDAVSDTVFVLERAHKLNILRAEDWQPPGHSRRNPLPSPHLLARATMQTSGRSATPSHAGRA
jgi:hypothetical protein